ncbi:MAG: indole-3-glycerol phosphate synthase TrpC [Oscillospiraceae bacterium]|nr:indole-3-glycerol phosphate synthase TrpC [Oscillospiraceae bacterium]
MILDEICEKRAMQLKTEKERCSLPEVRRLAEQVKQSDTKPGFIQAIRKSGLSCICEVKKASPSKGLIRPDFHPVELAKEYESAGADCISCLTEEYYFKGSADYLRNIAQMVTIPVLRKDFIIDPYQIYEAKVLGASAILLIAAVLELPRMEEYFDLAHSLELDCLVEVHTEEEMETVQRLHPQLLGVNNRNLKTFEVDLSTTERLSHLREPGQLFVSESGIKNNADMKTAQANGADAVLIGETLMRSDNIPETLHALREGTA